MKRLFLAAVALALSACGPMTATPPVSAGAVATADRVILTGERAFAVAELAYITAAKGVGIAADAGLIRGATAERVRGWNATARAALVRGKATTDAAVKARAAAELLGIADNLNALGVK